MPTCTFFFFNSITPLVPGSSAQVAIALLIVIVYMLLILKLAPFVDEADDWLSFFTNVQMMLTLLGGLLLMTDNPKDKTYDPHFMGIAMVAINSFGFVALLFGLIALHPKIRHRLNKMGGVAKKTRKDTKVKPKKDSVATSDAEKVKNWSDWSEDSDATAGTAANNLMVEKATEAPAPNLGDGPLTKSRQGLKRKKTTRQELRDVRKEYGTESKEYQTAINNMR